ncbi:hypothetical protein BSKO_07822 [Bryopsis sp. KO-2023]|nr:hypothetical protein BSKO_07822 [Bryopsis sp. KO-2023]
MAWWVMDEEHAVSKAELSVHLLGPPLKKRGYSCGPQHSPFRWLWSRGLICLLTSLVPSAMTSVLTKILENKYQAFELVFFQGMFAACTLTFWSKSSGKLILGPKSILHLTIPRGIFGALSIAFYYITLHLLPIGDGIALFYMNPIITASLSWILGVETIRTVMVIGVIFSMMGIVLVAQPPFLFGNLAVKWTTERTVGFATGGLSALFVSIAYLCVAKIGDRATSSTITLWFQFTAVLMSVPMLAIGFPRDAQFQFSAMEGLMMVATCAASLGAQVLKVRGFQLCNASIGAAVPSLELVLSYIIGYAVLNETLSLVKLAGATLMIIGVLCVAGGKK